MKFECNICPLCDKVLRLRRLAGVNVFECPGACSSTELPIDEASHYQVEVDSRIEVQHIIIYPYAIDTFGNQPMSRVYKLDNNKKCQLIMEIPRIRAEASDKLTERIQKLLTFL